MAKKKAAKKKVAKKAAKKAAKKPAKGRRRRRPRRRRLPRSSSPMWRQTATVELPSSTFRCYDEKEAPGTADRAFLFLGDGQFLNVELCVGPEPPGSAWSP